MSDSRKKYEELVEEGKIKLGIEPIPTRENYGEPVTEYELKVHYLQQFLSFEQFMELVESYLKTKK